MIYSDSLKFKGKLPNNQILWISGLSESEVSKSNVCRKGPDAELLMILREGFRMWLLGSSTFWYTADKEKLSSQTRQAQGIAQKIPERAFPLRPKGRHEDENWGRHTYFLY